LSLNGSWIEIDGSRLRSNLKAFRDLLATDTQLMVVVKSNAYGHGLQIVSETVADDVDWFGVDAFQEAMDVARIAPKRPILILGHSSADNIEAIVQQGFRQVIYRRDLAQAFSDAATRIAKPARVHLKIETGTNRQGIPLDEVAPLAESIAGLPGIEIEGVYTHFANIEDTLDPSYAELQLGRFKQAISSLEKVGIHPRQVHANATAGILLYPETHFTMVRLGIGAYGVWPSRETQIAARERGRMVSIQPALTWKTRIAQIKTIASGEYVGYGLSFQTQRPTTLAIIPVGYYEGYDRGLSNSGRALVGGRPVPIVGRVAMNMTVLDVTDVGPSLDDEVVLIGRQGANEITADELAERTGTISYEVLSRINPLLERRLV
jgi:alanine racemase